MQTWHRGVGLNYLYLWYLWSDLCKLGFVLKLRGPSIGPASPRVPASPREASPRVQKGGLVPALLHKRGMFCLSDDILNAFSEKSSNVPFNDLYLFVRVAGGNCNWMLFVALYVHCKNDVFHQVDIVACNLPRAPSYGGVRTWVEGSQMHWNRAQY